jgi:hypothetical protein
MKYQYIFLMLEKGEIFTKIYNLKFKYKKNDWNYW